MPSWGFQKGATSCYMSKVAQFHPLCFMLNYVTYHATLCTTHNKRKLVVSCLLSFCLFVYTRLLLPMPPPPPLHFIYCVLFTGENLLLRASHSRLRTAFSLSFNVRRRRRKNYDVGESLCNYVV